MDENYFITWEKKRGSKDWFIKKNFFNEKSFYNVSKKKYRDIYNSSIRDGGREKKKIFKLTEFLKSLETSVDFEN